MARNKVRREAIKAEAEALSKQLDRYLPIFNSLEEARTQPVRAARLLSYLNLLQSFALAYEQQADTAEEREHWDSLRDLFLRLFYMAEEIGGARFSRKFAKMIKPGLKRKRLGHPWD